MTGRTVVYAALLSLMLAGQGYAVQLVTGTYTGNGADDRNITLSPGCQPKAVFVARAPRSSSVVNYRTDSMAGDKTHQLNAAAALTTDRVQALNSNGFQAGTGINANTINYAYVAICDNGANDVATGSYSGNGSDNVNITISPSFQPEVVLVVPEDNSVNFFRGASSHGGDSASFFNSPLSSTANRIQQFNADGFQVGSAGNTNGVTYHYLAIRGNAAGVASGNYSGNASDSRDITVGFTPALVVVKGDSSNEEGAIRFASHSGDDAFCDTGVGTTDIIQAFGATTFQVGTDACSNESGVTMRWVAIATVTASGAAARRRNF